MSNTAKIACQQFNIKGAGETIQAASDLQDVFSPPYHGPRNIPIQVHIPKGKSYTHFPIVRTGRYAIYLETRGVFKGMVYSGVNQNTSTGTPIETDPVSTGGCKNFAEGFASHSEVIFTQNDPQPVALKFRSTKKEGQDIRYIVSLLEG